LDDGDGFGFGGDRTCHEAGYRDDRTGQDTQHAAADAGDHVRPHFLLLELPGAYEKEGIAKIVHFNSCFPHMSGRSRRCAAPKR
jgi:hypothetical protein